MPIRVFYYLYKHWTLQQHCNKSPEKGIRANEKACLSNVLVEKEYSIVLFCWLKTYVYLAQLDLNELTSFINEGEDISAPAIMMAIET